MEKGNFLGKLAIHGGHDDAHEEYAIRRRNEVKGREVSIAPRRKTLTSEALRYGSHSFYTANTPCLPLPRKCSPDGAITDSNSSRLIAAYYLFIDPKRMKG